MPPEAEKEEQIIYDDVEKTLNLPCFSRDESPFAIDNFYPTDSGEKALPVNVLIHANNFTSVDRKTSRPFACLPAHRGCLVFSLECRASVKAIYERLPDSCAGGEENSCSLPFCCGGRISPCWNAGRHLRRCWTRKSLRAGLRTDLPDPTSGDIRHQFTARAAVAEYFGVTEHM